MTKVLSSGGALMKPPKVSDPCGSHPEGYRDGPHECMPSERRCVYCAAALAPERCDRCKEFLTAADMHAQHADCTRCRWPRMGAAMERMAGLYQAM